MSWNDDSTDGLANIGMQFAENAVPGQIVELYRKQREENNPLPDNVPPVTFWGRIKSFFSGKSSKPGVTLSAPLVLSWLYYGKSFEAMVSMIEKQMKNPKADNADRLGCSLVIKQIIKVSIKNGFRSQEEWDKHFAMSDAIEKGCIGKWALQSVCKEDATRSIPEHSKKQTTAYTTTSIPESSVTSGRLKAKDLPLSSYIDCQNKDAVIEVLRKFLISQHTANGQALSYYALTQLELLTVKSDKEFSIGVIKEFGDILNTVTAENPESLLTDPRIEAMMSEKRMLEQRLAEYSAAEQHRKSAKSRLEQIFTILDGMKNHPLTFDNEIIRKILQCVFVESKDKIKVVFIGGLEVKVEVEQ